jgi:hypothetical protein
MAVAAANPDVRHAQCVAAERDFGTDGTFSQRRRCQADFQHREHTMGFGRGLLLWILGIPLPLILLLAIFMHH